MWRLVVALACLWGCGSPPPAPPTAVIDADPASVCYGDGFATTVKLSAARSSPALALVPQPVPEGAPPLAFEWSFSGAAVVVKLRYADGIDVATAGDRPLHVRLSARAADGGEATTLHTVPITLPEHCPGDPCCP